MTDSPPIPKPRSAFIPQNDPSKTPVPLPRTKVPTNNDRITASEIFRSIGTVSKQLTEDVALKVSTSARQITEDVALKVSMSAKSANEKIEKSLMDGSKFAKGTLEKTLTTSRAMRDSVTKSVIEGTKTAGLRLRRAKKNESVDDIEATQRCVSMPVVDVSLFDNIQFNSPLLEQKRSHNNQNQQDLPSLNLNSSHLDNVSLFSSNSDSNTDTLSNFSHDDSREFDQSSEQLTYDTPKQSRKNSVISTSSAPEIPERRKKRSTMDVGYMRNNSLYENWNPPSEASNERPSKSTIYEFDPLNTSSSVEKYEGISNELLLLESFLVGDMYGTIVSTDSNEENYDFGESDYFNPPTPPERSDSLFPSETDVKVEVSTIDNAKDKDRNSNWFVTGDCTIKPLSEEEVRPSNSVIQKFSNILKLDSVLNKPAKQPVSKVNVVERPQVNKLPMPYFSGILSRIITGGVDDLFKNSQIRYCVLSNQKIMCYTDPTNTILKEAYLLDNIYSVQIVLPLSSSTTPNSYCFDIVVSNGGVRGTPRKITFSSQSASDRRNWAQKIAEHLTGFPTKYTSEFTRCGWCYMKEGVSGAWRGVWIMLIRRVLVYNLEATDSTEDLELCAVDLRKTRCVVTQEADEETKKLCPGECSGSLVLDCPHATLYLRFSHEKELKGWRYMIKLAAHNNGAQIHHQQLTKEDVPTVVDKCISFIYAHGTLSEGIYRRAGSASALGELLARFRRDAWAVQLSPAQHSEHEVAGVLKRFLRDLPSPLVATAERRALVAALDLTAEEERYAEYRRVLASLPPAPVAGATARKLFAHLHFVHTMSHANRMPALNLAAVWAPTLMPAPLSGDSVSASWSSREVRVVYELIEQYERVWRPSEADRRRETAVRAVLSRVLAAQTARAPPAGDLRVWFYLFDKTTCHQLALTPSKTCADICIELSERAKRDSHLLTIEEVICGESMRRIIHVDEVVLDVVLRWGYWDEEDRKDNYLMVKGNEVLHEMEAARRNAASICGELRFASDAAKAFKLHWFEVQDGNLCYYKDKQGSLMVDSWRVADMVWYEGYEPRRNPHARWAITFVHKDKQKRTKERPWFGHTLAGAVVDDRLRWATALTFAAHHHILPTPRLVVT